MEKSVKCYICGEDKQELIYEIGYQRRLLLCENCLDHIFNNPNHLDSTRIE